MAVGLPELKIELAPTAGASTVSPTWVDVTGYWYKPGGLRFNRGNADERASAQPGTLAISLINDGRFTPGNTSGAYHPLKLRCPIRVSIKRSGVWVVMWTGLVDEFDSVPANRQICRVKASDRLSQVARVMLQRWETEQHLAASPTYLWPLTDSAGSTSVGEVASGVASDGNVLSTAQVGSGGSFELSVGGLPVDDGTVAAFNPVDVSNGVYLRTTSATVGGSYVGHVYSVMMNGVTNAASTMVRIVDVYGDYVDLSINASGKAVASQYSVFSGTTVTATSTTTVTDGEWHVVTLVVATASSVKVYVDGTLEATTSSTLGAISGSTIYVGGTPSGRCFSGQLSHVAIWVNQSYAATMTTAPVAAASGATGETSTDRFERVCAFGGVTAGTVGTGLSTLGKQAINGASLLEALNDIATSELVPMYCAADGTPTLASRDERYGASTVFTLTAKDVNPETSFTVNDERLVNDVTVSRASAADARATDTDSITQYGRHSQQLTVLVDSDAQQSALAQWLANVNSEPASRTEQLDIAAWSKQATIDIDDLLAVEIGSRIGVTGLPSSLTSTLDLFVEGVSDEFSTSGWRRTLNTSPVGASGSVWILDDATYSVLDETTILAA